MKYPVVFIFLLLMLLLSACKRNYTCTCTTGQIVYNTGAISGLSSSFDRTYSYRAIEQKKAEQDCFSSHAAETYTTTGPTQTVVATTTCSIK